MRKAGRKAASTGGWLRGKPSLAGEAGRRLPYEQALSRMLSLDKFGSKLGLSRIRRLLSALGNPQSSFKCIIVGGSNGKGSTTEMIGAALQEEGLETGTYFSPQIETFPERFRINGKNASKARIASAYGQVEASCSKHGIRPTFFEVVTAVAFVIFRSEKVDWAVLEVGLGGRLDAANAAEPEVSAITSISLEHTQQLGGTLSKIAHEKCGIARKGKPLVCGFLPPEAKKAVLKSCKKEGAIPIFTDGEVEIGKLAGKDGAYSFIAEFEGTAYSLSLSAPGKFQIGNACVALAACAKLGIGKKAIERGLAKARPSYRFQKVSASPATIADCAHNPEAASALAQELAILPGKAENRVLLFSAMQDKDFQHVLGILSPHFGKLVLCEVSLPRSAGLRQLFSAAKRHYSDITLVKSPKRALARARGLAGKKGTVVAAGSIYLLAELFGTDKSRLAQ